MGDGALAAMPSSVAAGPRFWRLSRQAITTCQPSISQGLGGVETNSRGGAGGSFTVRTEGTDLTAISARFTFSCPYLTNREWSFRGHGPENSTEREMVGALKDWRLGPRSEARDWSLAGCWGASQTTRKRVWSNPLASCSPHPAVSCPSVEKSLSKTVLGPAQRAVSSFKDGGLTSL